MANVTVRLLGGMGLPVARQGVEVALPAGATVRDLVARLEVELGVDELAARLAEHCLLAVNGTEIGHLGGWETELPPGAIVSIVPAMVGG